MEDQKASGFSEQSHTADWALRVWAPDFYGLLCEAARGMYTLMGVEAATSPMETRSIAVAGDDSESWLVAFLNELLFMVEQEAMVFIPVSFNVDGRMLSAMATGTPLLRVRKEIKAVTYHRLAIQCTPDRQEVTIVFDV